MKIWYHVLAAVVGLAIAALIVYLVFGSASEQGARQEGSAGELSAEGTLCGEIEPGKTSSAEARELAGENLPSIVDQEGPIPAISRDQPEHQDWVERVHAASGLCLDEIRIEPSGTTLTMSTVEGVDEAEASAYAAGAVSEAFTPPFNPPRVTLRATVGESERTAVVSRRAWNAFEVRREALDVPLTMGSLAQFRQATSYSRQDLRVSGWSAR